MNPRIWRTRLIVAASAIAAVWMGSQIAGGDYLFPVMVAGALAVLVLAYAQPVPVGTLVLGIGVFGYIASNRGFAQISVFGPLILLPAEFMLLVSGGILACRSALGRELPWRRDAINVTLVAWMVLSSIRLVPDVRTFGLLAVRDFAAVYYASFFFIAQNAGGFPVDRSFLRRSLLAGFVALLLIYPLYTQFPDFFLDRLTLQGSPVIFYKGDLVGIFLAAGSVLLFSQFEKGGSRVSAVLSLAMAGATMTTNSRAAMLALAVPALVLWAAGRRRYLVYLGGMGVASIAVILAVSQIRGQRLDQTPIHDMYERVLSLADPNGENSYSGEETSSKGDNNAFRTTWWKVIIDETLSTNPWLGLGWGYDLAEPFIRVYQPEGGDEFSARSPHNLAVTIFTRTGVLGIVPFAALMASIAIRGWRAIKSRSEGSEYWCAALAVLTSAFFGVVLEGPMGAVLFWTLLGLANSPAPPALDPPIQGGPTGSGDAGALPGSPYRQ